MNTNGVFTRDAKTFRIFCTNRNYNCVKLFFNLVKLDMLTNSCIAFNLNTNVYKNINFSFDNVPWQAKSRNAGI